MFKLFDLTLKLNGFPMSEAVSELNRIISLSEAEHYSFIEKKKKEILQFHLNNNSYYRDFVGKKAVENWNDIPVMSKKDFQNTQE